MQCTGKLYSTDIKVRKYSGSSGELFQYKLQVIYTKLSFSTGKLAAFHCRKLLYNWLKVYVFEDVINATAI